MLRERNEAYMLLFAVIDMVIAFISFLLAFTIRFYIETKNFVDLFSIQFQGYLFIGIIITISQVLVFYFIGMYQPGRMGFLKNESGSIIVGTIISILIALGVIFFLKTFRYSRLVIFYFGIVNIFLVILSRSILLIIINGFHTKGKQLESILVVGSGKSAVQIESVILKNKLFGYKIEGFISLPGDKSGFIEDARILGNIDNLSGILSKVKPYHVIYAADSANSANLRKAIIICSYEGINLHFALNFSELFSSNVYFENLDGIPLISIRDIPSRKGFNRFLKRVFDFLFSLFFMVIFSPLYLFIAFMIKLTSPGPVLFSQERVGLNNKIFKLLKFRTMYVQQPGDSDKIWTKNRDPRVTPVGRILRRFSLDEIPQFFNVFTGDMSVVGPRPERPYWVEQFKEQYKGYMQRHGVKAGITGWAQINGLRGDTSIEDRVSADIYYIENWSFFMDLKIILLTPFKSIIDRNAY